MSFLTHEIELCATRFENVLNVAFTEIYALELHFYNSMQF